MFYLIGADGFVGSAFGRYFHEAGVDFQPITRQNYADYVSTGCDVLINADGNSRKYLAAKDPKLDFKLNVQSAMNSLVDFDCDLYVLLSSLDVYNDVSDPNNNHEDVSIRPEELSNYGFSKYLAELFVQKYSRNWLIVRLCGMVGEGLNKNPIYDLLNAQPLRVSPHSTYHYLNTEDVAKIVYRLISDGYRNQIFNVCSDGVITISEVQSMLGITSEDNDTKTEHYNVNIQKLKSLYPVPSATATVREFISYHNKKQPLVAIVSPVYNNKEDTKEFLESLKQVTYPNLEIVIIDDGSTDGLGEMLDTEYPYVAVVKGDGEWWSARSYHMGTQKAMEMGAKYALWIDNDTVVDPEFISAMVETAERNPKSLVTGKVYSYYEPDKIVEAGGNMCWWKGGYRARGCYHTREGLGELDIGQYDEECDVPCGTTGVLLNTSFYADIGEIDWKHFPNLRWDIDFTYRAHKKGYRIIYQPKSKAWHKVSSTAKKTGIATQRLFLKNPISTTVYALSKKSRGGALSVREVSRFYLRHFPWALPYILTFYIIRHFIREISGDYEGRYY